MKNRLLPLIALLSLTPTISLALFCPKNFNVVQLGDQMSNVSQLCGAPDSQTTSTQTNDNVPQQWSYFIPQQSIGGTSPANIQVVYSFDANGNVINIMVNNLSVSTTDICGQTVQVGDSRDSVKTACGTASFVNKQNASTNGPTQQSSAVTVVKYTYNSTPPVTLVFTNGVLTGTQ